MKEYLPRFVKELAQRIVDDMNKDAGVDANEEIEIVITGSKLESEHLIAGGGVAWGVTLRDRSSDVVDLVRLIVNLQDGIAYLNNGYCRISRIYPIVIKDGIDKPD